MRKWVIRAWDWLNISSFWSLFSIYFAGKSCCCWVTSPHFIAYLCRLNLTILHKLSEKCEVSQCCGVSKNLKCNTIPEQKLSNLFFIWLWFCSTSTKWVFCICFVFSVPKAIFCHHLCPVLCIFLPSNFWKLATMSVITVLSNCVCEF